LLEHQKPIEHQVERSVFAIAEAEYLYVVQYDRAASWRDILCTTSKNATVRTCECAFLYCDIIQYVEAMDLDVRVRKGDKPAPIELHTGRLSLAANPRRLEDDVVREHRRKSLDVVSVESVCSFLENFSRSHERNMAYAMNRSK
jgi:hypothetical protein